MVHNHYFNTKEKEATEEELKGVAITAISILSIVALVFTLLTFYFIS